MDYEDSKLEDKYDDFRLLMNEYRDGMLLFELTDEKVWSKAVKDTTGLEAYYEANKSSYMWGERVKGTIYTCDNKKVAKKARKGVKKGLSDVELESKFNQESSLIFQHKTDTFEKGSADELDLIDWSVGVSKVYEKKNGQFIFVEVDEILPETQKAFDETRGPVTADYQKHLEDLWVKELRGKYAFKLNKDVLYSIADK